MACEVLGACIELDIAALAGAVDDGRGLRLQASLLLEQRMDGLLMSAREGRALARLLQVQSFGFGQHSE